MATTKKLLADAMTETPDAANPATDSERLNGLLNDAVNTSSNTPAPDDAVAQLASPPPIPLRDQVSPEEQVKRDAATHFNSNTTGLPGPDSVSSLAPGDGSGDASPAAVQQGLMSGHQPPVEPLTDKGNSVAVPEGKHGSIPMGVNPNGDTDYLAKLYASMGIGGPGGGFGAYRNSGDQGPVSMQHMDLKGVDHTADFVKANSDQANAAIALNDASTPVLKNEADEQARLGQKLEQGTDASLMQSQDFITKAAAANERAAAMVQDPDHYWNSLSPTRKVLSVFGQLVAGAGAGATGKANQATEYIKEAIDRDTQAQMTNHSNQLAAAKGYESLATVAHQMFADKGQQFAWLSKQKFDQSASMLRYLGSKYANPAIRAAADAAAAKLEIEGAERVNTAKTQDNVATHTGAQARLANAEAARAYNAMGLDRAKFGMDALKMRTMNQQGALFDPYDNKPVVDAQGNPIVLTETEAPKVREQMQMHANVLRGLDNADQLAEQTGVLPGAGNSAFTAAKTAALTNLPKEQRDELEKVMDGAYSSTRSIKASLQAVRQQIAQRRQSLLYGVSGNGAYNVAASPRSGLTQQ